VWSALGQPCRLLHAGRMCQLPNTDTQKAAMRPTATAATRTLRTLPRQPNLRFISTGVYASQIVSDSEAPPVPVSRETVWNLSNGPDRQPPPNNQRSRRPSEIVV
jgi:hypothetical protein